MTILDRNNGLAWQDIGVQGVDPGPAPNFGMAAIKNPFEWFEQNNKEQELAKQLQALQGQNMQELAGQALPQQEGANMGSTGQLGGLSSKYESSGNPMAYNPNDNNRGASYGTYQINEGSGTFNNLVDWLDKRGQGEAAASLRNTTGAGRKQVWDNLVNSGVLSSQAQHQFIKESHYDPALANISNPKLRHMVGNSPMLQDVLWSSAVQHGSGGGKGRKGASNIFNNVYRDGMTPTQLVDAIYNERGNVYGGTPGVRQRYASERVMARNMRY